MYDVYKIREQFPMLSKQKYMQGKPLVFLDNASTTFKPQCVIDAIVKYYTEENSNSHRGDYDLCYNMDVEIENTRKTIAKFVNCDFKEVVFTSGDTMSLNLIANSYGRKFLKKGDEVVLSYAEHSSDVLPWYQICNEVGAVIKFIPLSENGELLPQNLELVMSEKTKVVSIANVGNVLGYTANIKGLAAVAHKHGAVIVVDGAQSVPHDVTDFKGWDIDFLTFSAHKMCGPTGIGCLIGKYDLLDKMDPFIVGGGNNITFGTNQNVEYLNPPVKFEAGTLHLAGILGFKAAVEFIMSIGIENIRQHDQELFDYAIKELDKLDNVIVYNKQARGGVITFNVKDVFAQDEATLLNSKGIAVRSGQHCAKILNGFLKTPATCRMSTYLYTTKEEIDALVNALKEGGDILDAYFK